MSDDMMRLVEPLIRRQALRAGPCCATRDRPLAPASRRRQCTDLGVTISTPRRQRLKQTAAAQLLPLGFR